MCLMEDACTTTLHDQLVTILKELIDLDLLRQVELSQKAKIQWGIEGDENSGFFHNTLNRKRPQVAIQGVLRDDIWVDDLD